MKKLCSTLAIAFIGVLLLTIVAVTNAGQDKTDVCHITGVFDFGNGDVPIGHVIYIADPAFPAHMEHGDPEAYAIVYDDHGNEYCTAETQKLVFVTSETSSGNLGGLVGADAKCQTLANNAGLEGTYTAWLSVLNSSGYIHAKDRIAHSTKPLITTAGDRIAASLQDLLDYGADVPIDRNEYGVAVDYGSVVFTSTLPNGTYALGSEDCSDWTNDYGGNYTRVGSTWSSGLRRWTSDDYLSCSSDLRIYCFEQ